MDSNLTINGSILIVDDNPTNLDLLFQYLDRSGFKVFIAEDGVSAIKQAQYSKPNLILLDIMMPGLDGFETCRRLQAEEATKAIPIIFMTALADMTDKLKGFAVGAVDYITKPFQYQEVLARVKTHLRLQNLQEELTVQNAQLQEEIIERKRAEARLIHRAFYDPLTDLPNRALFLKFLEHSITALKDNPSHKFSILTLDIDRFKIINDTLGRSAGDQFLVAIARRLEESVQLKDIVAYFGEDQFAILLNDIPNEEAVDFIAERIKDNLAQPITLDGQPIFTTASIGAVTNTKHYVWPEDLLRDADTAMYQAKRQGKARLHLFSQGQTQKQTTNRLQLETDLWQALKHQEFEVYYQPIVSLTTGQITSVEALLRWQHPRYGFVSPEIFIPLAEETGLIVPIGTWLLDTAFHQIAQWHQAGHIWLDLGVNISIRQLQQPDLLPLITTLLAKSTLPAQALKLEITERLPLEEYQVNLVILDELRVRGVSISVDDFGLDSSLDRLKFLPLDILKIDQSFVRGMTANSADATIIAAMIKMAHSLNLTVIAEGVETEDQLRFLQAQQCDEIQGYLVSKPLTATALAALLPVRQLINIAAILPVE